ncbi:hypothetical protein CROQUDRAFT_66178 [Cronartium quercuum f. sp. fusiforme G11]|uniref:Shieldin complex subunit 2 first OB fold domain-containing protein n=1 Tax=Cronartium quercuum f. sp. fusiforme G11 TaxID=708437 RepID=A0A9P6NB95_9BASI|nr:hypothetical protein CROQUDRAFT_66178 [Cronartium quercuum f. sp. fusiforme G11]
MVTEDEWKDEYEILETQLISRDDVTDESRWTEGTSCLYPSPTQVTQTLDDSRIQRDEETYSESLVYNPPEWYFESQSCTPLDKLDNRRGALHNLLFHLNDIQPIRTIPLKKSRRGQTTASLAEFECMDDSGTTLKVTLWDDAAAELATACRPGDIIFLSSISLSTFRDHLQGSTTNTTRAQICFRLRPFDLTDDTYRSDLRLDFDLTTRRVRELVNWAKKLFEYD